MKHLNYIFSSLRLNRWDSLIKVLSIGLGVAVSSFLLVRVAYDQSIDTCFDDSEDIYQLWMEYELNGNKLGAQQQCVGMLPIGVAEELPEMVVAGTPSRVIGDATFEGRTLDGNVMIANKEVFEILGVPVTEGADLTEFDTPHSVYVSDRYAKQISPDGDVVGKEISLNNCWPLTVKGVFRSWGDETTINADAIMSFNQYITENEWGISWRGGDSWFSYIRVKPGTDRDALNRRIKDLVKTHMPDTETMKMEAWAAPLTDTYRSSDQVKHITLVLSILAAAILLVSALNYVLLSVASLNRRAKAVGVLKCSGAGRGGIFSMFIWESVFIMLGGAVVMVLIFLATKEWAYDTLYSEVTSHVSLDRLWVIAGVVVLVFMIAAILPAQMFSGIPVSTVFRRSSEKRNGWKYPLLFIEFAGIALITGMLMVVGKQYKVLTESDYGFNPDRVAIVGAHFPIEKREKIIDHLKSLPYVEQLSSSNGFPGYGYSGEFIRDASGTTLFSSKFDNVADDYIGFMGMTVKEGRMPEKNANEVIVNAEFVNRMNWRMSEAIGKTFQLYEDQMTVVGVMNDFMVTNYYDEARPFFANVIIYPGSRVHVRLKEPFRENFLKLQDELQEVYPTDNIMTIDLEERLRDTYSSVRVFEQLTGIAGCVVFFIAMIGLVGYMRDEMRRRAREIAIRKVNGASAADILSLMGFDVLKIAFPAIVAGMAGAYVIGLHWLEQFSVTLDNMVALFVLASVGLLVVIMGVAFIFSWRTSRMNPVISLKTE